MVRTPARASVAARFTVTAPRYQPLVPSTPLGVAVVAGLVLSMLMPDTTVEALLPARSVAEPLTAWAAPSALSVTGAVTVAMPDRLSLAVKLTTTSVLFQPSALAAGAREP